MATKKTASNLQKGDRLAHRVSSGRFLVISNERTPAKGSVAHKVAVIGRNVKTGQFTSTESVRSIKRNSEKYSAVLKRLAKK